MQRNTDMNMTSNETRFGLTVIVLLTAASIIGGSIFGYITSEVRNLSGISDLQQFKLSVPTRIYDVNGLLISELFLQKRELVGYYDLPRPLINAFIATEDQAFYHHAGINFNAILRAFIRNIQAGRVVQGGSTITQQLAKRLFTDSQRTLKRKIQEAVLALQIEKRFSKEEILEMYLNQIFLGHGCYGVSSAARHFFDKDVTHLSLIESSIMAALPSAPGRYSPMMNQHEAYAKNRDILSRMVDSGFVTREYADKQYAEFWPEFIKSRMTDYPTKTAYTQIIDNAPHFTNYVRQILVSRFGKEAVYDQGLQVYTTLDLSKQYAAERHLQDGVKRQTDISEMLNRHTRSGVDRSLFGTYNQLRTIFNLPPVMITHDIESRTRRAVLEEYLDTIDIVSLLADSTFNQETMEKFRSTTALGVSSNLEVEGALISIEPRTGYIAAMVGGSDFNVDNQLNRAVSARRQPGSAFKPFVYGAGIESHILTSGTTISDAPLVNIDAHGSTWAPGNYAGSFSGLVTVKHAIIMSINTIAVRAYDMIGPARITEYSSRMLKVPPFRFSMNPTLSLGTSELTPFEMANAYAIYANRGRDVIPHAIRYVLDSNGNEIANIEQEVGNVRAIKELNGEIQIISEDVAYIMTDIMRGVIDKGTARTAVRTDHGFHLPAAGKTGSTSNWTDAWFCGYTPDMATVVWVGYDRPFLSLGKHQAGGAVAAPIWAGYMKEIYQTMSSSSFPPPPDSVYQRAGYYFLQGTQAQGAGARIQMQSLEEILEEGLNQ